MTPDDEARAAEIQARSDAATEGPWIAYFTVHGDPWIVTDKVRPSFTTIAKVDTGPADYGARNNLFIGHARADVPWLLGRLRDETARADKAEAAIERVRSFCGSRPDLHHQLVRSADVIRALGEASGFGICGEIVGSVARFTTPGNGESPGNPGPLVRREGIEPPTR